VLQDYPNKFLARSQCVKYSFKILKFWEVQIVSNLCQNI
jgi:hypothetical protein